MSDWYRVEVTDHEGQIVAIEPEMLAGRDIGEKERATILSAIAQLEGFVGRGDASFIVEAIDRATDNGTPSL